MLKLAKPMVACEGIMVQVNISATNAIANDYFGV
jgi:hypothetical protein